jgi:large subunit ribosomal protein L21
MLGRTEEKQALSRADQEEQQVFAVVKSGGKQYRVEPGQLLKVDRLAGNVNDEVRLDNVLMVSGDDGITIGTPTVSGLAVRTTIMEQTKGEKIVVFKFKSKKRYRKTRGHRSQLTILKIEEILQG